MGFLGYLALYFFKNSWKLTEIFPLTISTIIWLYGSSGFCSIIYGDVSEEFSCGFFFSILSIWLESSTKFKYFIGLHSINYSIKFGACALTLRNCGLLRGPSWDYDVQSYLNILLRHFIGIIFTPTRPPIRLPTIAALALALPPSWMVWATDSS